MIKNFKNNTLTDSLVSGAAAIALIAGVGIAAAPAQAGTLEWGDGTSDFFSDFVDVDLDDLEGTLPDDFSVIFSPDSLGGQAAVSIATVEFAPFFDVPPLELVDLVSPPTGNFEFIEGSVDGLTFEYELQNNVVFEFDNGVEVVFGAGEIFLGDLEVEGDSVVGVEFLEETIASDVTIPGIPADELIAGAEELTFGSVSPDGGGYQGEVVVSGTTTPEPTTILGLLAVGGLGLGLKRKKQSKQLSA